MNDSTEPRILAAERVRNSVLITFDDGECAVFSAALLYATLPQADPVPQEDESTLDD